jgi:tetratricopeptide (TPR) repeat protein
MKRLFFPTLLILIFFITAVAQKSRAISSSPNNELTRQYKSLIQALNRISEIYYYEGKLDDAWQTLENGAQLLKGKEVSPEDAARFQIQRGKILYYQDSLAGGDYQKSIAFLLETNKTVETINDDRLKAEIADLIGRAVYSQAFLDGDFETALKYFREALTISQKIGDRQGVALSLFHHGLVYENRKNSTSEDKGKAFEYYRQALDLAEKGSYKLEAAYLYRHLAFIYQERGDLDKALDYLTKSFALREEIGFKIYLSPAALAVGDLYLRKKDYAKADEFYQKGLSLAEAVNGQRFIVMSLLSLGDLQRAKGDSAKALDYFKRALKLAEDTKNTEGVKTAADRIAKLSKADTN